MEQNNVSATALITAFARAYHAMHDEPKIFDDFFAEKMLTKGEYAFFAKSLADALQFFNPELAATKPSTETALEWVMKTQNAPITISRAKFAEDYLKMAIKQGVDQYVILGAGLETFAFREPDLMKQLHVYELDHPATQAFKQNRLSELGWKIPSGLEFIPIDFSKETLAEVLNNSSYNPKKLTFFSWLGVTYYLSKSTVIDTLRSVREVASNGSSIVFDYIDSDGFDPLKASKRMQLMQAIVERVGEPMKTCFDPAMLGEEMMKICLQLQEDLNPSEIEERYFKDRTDGYHAFEHVHFASVKVCV